MAVAHAVRGEAGTDTQEDFHLLKREREAPRFVSGREGDEREGDEREGEKEEFQLYDLGPREA
jgi:hypothetical protein